MVLPQEIIRRKRDGLVLTSEQIGTFIAGLGDGRVTDAQAAAWLMAVRLRGMDRAETVALTLAMRDSGAVLDWRGLDAPVVDKHSTGGIGDKVSLILAPLLAACGVYVPMLSGRGLGHTGGTLDKLDSIPGYHSQPDRETVQLVVRAVGFAIVGASDDLTPADRRLYALRDVTATVDSLPLIVASILSKKLAGGAQALVMDVKAGSGALMPDVAAAEELAHAIVEVANGAGLRTCALITDMSQPLGHSIGNALEVAEAVAVLRDGAGDARLVEVTLALAAEALALCGVAPDLTTARRLAEARLRDGCAAETFARGVAALGGPADVLTRTDIPAPVIRDVPSPRGGMILAIDGIAIGLAIIALGGGRTRPGDKIDARVGFSGMVGLGTVLRAGEALCQVHAADDASAKAAAAAVSAAVVVGDAARGKSALVLRRIG